jgi:hypothetical protein
MTSAAPGSLPLPAAPAPEYRTRRNRAIGIYAAASAIGIVVLYLAAPWAALLFGLVVVPQVGRVLLWIVLRRGPLDPQGPDASPTTASGFARL